MIPLRPAPLVLALLAALALPAPPTMAQEAAPARVEELIRDIRRLDVLERLQAARAGLEQDLAAAPAGQGLSPEEVARQIAERLGVDVLEVQPADIDGQQVYAVRTMNPAGNFNDAFMVSVVLVDPLSGDVLGQAPASTVPVHSLATGTPRLPNEGLEIRRRTYR